MEYSTENKNKLEWTQAWILTYLGISNKFQNNNLSGHHSNTATKGTLKKRYLKCLSSAQIFSCRAGNFSAFCIKAVNNSCLKNEQLINVPCDSKNENISTNFTLVIAKQTDFRDSQANTKNTKYHLPLTNFADGSIIDFWQRPKNTPLFNINNITLKIKQQTTQQNQTNALNVHSVNITRKTCLCHSFFWVSQKI